MDPNRAATWIAFRSIAKRTLTTPTPTRYCPLHYQQNLRQTLTSTAAQSRKIPKNHFTSNSRVRQESKPLEGSLLKPNDIIEKETSSKKRKAAANRPISLRKVAVEAQRTQQGLVRGTGRLRYISPGVETKDVSAFCAAEIYNLSTARGELEKLGYKADPFGTGLFPQVLHVQKPRSTGAKENGDVFVFPSGCAVFWNVPERLAREIVTKVLPAAAGDTGLSSERLEEEEMEYVEDPMKDTSRIVGDTIILGTKATPESHDASSSSHTETLGERAEVDTILAKIAFSSALSRSTKLAVLENSLSAYFTSTQSIPLTLASGKPLRFTRAEILQKTGELLLIRAQLNLYSELTDSLPDLFWDSPHELGLEGYYEMVGKALDVGVRIRGLNEKMDYAGEIAAVLRERLSEKQGWMLEWMIIGLICIEVGFGVVHLWREGEMVGEMESERRTRELLEVWLERELKKEP